MNEEELEKFIVKIMNKKIKIRRKKIKNELVNMFYELKSNLYKQNEINIRINNDKIQNLQKQINDHALGVQNVYDEFNKLTNELLKIQLEFKYYEEDMYNLIKSIENMNESIKLIIENQLKYDKN